jgi:hypothetical protein
VATDLLALVLCANVHAAYPPIILETWSQSAAGTLFPPQSTLTPWLGSGEGVTSRQSGEPPSVSGRKSAVLFKPQATVPAQDHPG